MKTVHSKDYTEDQIQFMKNGFQKEIFPHLAKTKLKDIKDIEKRRVLFCTIYRIRVKKYELFFLEEDTGRKGDEDDEKTIGDIDYLYMKTRLALAPEIVLFNTINDAEIESLLENLLEIEGNKIIKFIKFIFSRLKTYSENISFFRKTFKDIPLEVLRMQIHSSGYWVKCTVEGFNLTLVASLYHMEKPEFNYTVGTPMSLKDIDFNSYVLSYGEETIATDSSC